VPLRVPGKIIGVINLTTNSLEREFATAEKTLVETIAGQVAGAIENARLMVNLNETQDKSDELRPKRNYLKLIRGKSASGGTVFAPAVVFRKSHGDLLLEETESEKQIYLKPYS